MAMSRGPWRVSSHGPTTGAVTPTTTARTANAAKNSVRLQPSSSVIGRTKTLAPQMETPEPRPEPTKATPTMTQP